MSDFAAVCYNAPNEGDVYVDVKFQLRNAQAVMLDAVKAEQVLTDFPDWFEAVDMDCDAVLKEGTLVVNEPFDYPIVVEGVAPVARSTDEPSVAVEDKQLYDLDSSGELVKYVPKTDEPSVVTDDSALNSDVEETGVPHIEDASRAAYEADQDAEFGEPTDEPATEEPTA